MGLAIATPHPPAQVRDHHGIGAHRDLRSQPATIIVAGGRGQCRHPDQGPAAVEAQRIILGNTSAGQPVVGELAPVRNPRCDPNQLVLVIVVKLPLPVADEIPVRIIPERTAARDIDIIRNPPIFIVTAPDVVAFLTRLAGSFRSHHQGFPRLTGTALDVGGPCLEAFGMISES